MIGADVKLTNANRAFYRVVAVDEQGNAERTFRFRRGDLGRSSIRVLLPMRKWDRSTATRCPPSARSETSGRAWSAAKETMNYWDLEAPRFALQQGPTWLKIDASTGLLSGVPDRPGKVAIVVTATIDREVRSLDARMLSWGVEKIVSTGTQRVGVATQKFTIDVAP